MSPQASFSPTSPRQLRQAVRLPRESDGVGNALRVIFDGSTAVPSDFTALLSRLDKEN